MAHEIKNILFLIAIAVFSIFYYLDVRQLPEPEERSLVVILLIGLGILLIVETGRSIVRGIKNRKDENNTSFFQDLVKWLKGRQSLLLISMIAYVILIPIIGFYVTSFLFIVFLNYFLESRKIWELTVLPLVLLLLIYLLFNVFLGVNLPEGFLF